MSEQRPKKPATAVIVKPATLPAKILSGSQSALTNFRKLELTKGLPPATIVYGSASGVLFALSLYFLVTGHWVNGLLTMLPAACFLGYALLFMKQGPQPPNL